MNLKTVSVVMAVYIKDNPEYFQKAIFSVLQQSYPITELIIVADGPITQELTNVINFFTEKFNNLCFLQLSENKGPATARNFGILNTKSDFIAIMDADDLCHKDRIKKQIEILSNDNIDIVSTFLVEFIDENDIDLNKVHKMPVLHHDIRKMAAISCPIASATILGKSSILKKYNYNTALKVGEDYSLWIQMLQADIKFQAVPEPLYFYRTNGDFGSRRNGWKYAKSDFINKIKALNLVSWYLVPFLCLMAFIGSFVRMLPPSIFVRVRNILHNILRK